MMHRPDNREPQGNRRSESPQSSARCPWRDRRPRSQQPQLELLETRVVLSPTIFTVDDPGNSASGSGTSGTLPYVISQANANPNADGSEIDFDAAVFNSTSPQTITLGATLELAETAGPEVIDGPGAGAATVSGGGTVRVFQVDNGVTASLSGLTISGGSTTGLGGGVSNGGTIALTNCTVSGNSAGDSGGGISSDGTTTLTSCTVSDNTSDKFGGGISIDGTTKMTDCTVSGNSAAENGGGISSGGPTTLTNCTVSDNSASGFGGGLSCNDGTAALTSCTVSGNSAADSGGGMSSVCPTMLTSCTVSENTSDKFGGGISINALATLTNCTVSGNSAADGGGGMSSAGSTALTNCTVSDNMSTSGFGGIYLSGTATLSSTIVAGNTDSSGASDIAGPGSVSGSNNLIGTGGSGGITGGNSGNIVLTSLTNLGLAPLGEYGGPTETMALLPGSAAIGAGTAASGITTDQRGQPLDSPPDIGAFQTQTAMVVDTTLDGNGSPSGVLSLRQAVNLANALGGAETISFDPTVFAAAQTILLTQGQLELSDTTGPQTITGPAAGVTVSGGGTSRVFQVDEMVTASISDLTITGGSTTGYGGGLFNNGTTTLDGVTVSGNSAAGGGGGISTSGSTMLTNCTVSNNTADQDGGGINSFETTTTLTNCTVSGNSAGDAGGGLGNFAGTAALANCTFSDNRAKYGGGLWNNGPSTTITGCTISGNSASQSGAGVWNSGTTTLDGVTVSGNSAVVNGGGLASYGTMALSATTVGDNTAGGYGGGIIIGGMTTLTACALSGNSAAGGGGGISTSGPTALTNCTVSDNTADGVGGGINSFETTTALTNCTVSGNTSTSASGGIYLSGTATLNNTIVATNSDVSGASDIGGPGTASGLNNLIGTGGSGGLVNEVDGNLVGVLDPGLAPLGDYGGPTQTMGLVPGSAAIGAGTAASGVTTDQRGAPRPTAGSVDIGAFQDQGYTLAVSSGSPQSTLVNLPFGSPLIAVLTEDFASAPLPGVTISFSAPSLAASAALSASSAVTGASGLASVTAAANATAGTFAVTASAVGVTSSASYNLTNQIGPSFAGLRDQTVSYGSAVSVSGTVAAGVQVPAGEDVAVTVDGVTHDATIASDGSFSTQFTRADVVLDARSTAYIVTYNYATDGVFLAAHGSSQLTVHPAQLTVRANNESTVSGSSLPALTYTITGFVSGDTPANLTTPPVLSTTATPSSTPGSYPITLGGASSPNYAITYVPGTLTVILAPATVQSVTVEKFKLSKHKTVQGIVLQFSEALDSADAQNINAYTLATIPNNKTQKSKPVQLSQATYNSSAFTVSLLTRKTLALNPPLELTVKAASLLDALGRELDGNDSGQPGANFTAVLSKTGTKVTSAKLPAIRQP